ncbi:hypothetical protein MN116_007918 [Schistosoma mekongi]|uniref:TATA-binding protein-associated factor n=1 Tax=Schistosoma mekongi TaxID=38744 RepID=A0AAE2D288_SCHME|nr:hypothetical protein MN116_007918 [Schistosoma mekongi]
MTSRLDRLFALLENCPNASLRTTAAEQLGEVARNCPSNIDYVFTRLLPLLRHKNWVSRIAASEAIRSIVRHLPDWNPTLQCQSNMDQKCIPVNGFLSLSELRIDCVLAQGARLYSMDARELDKSNKRSSFDRCKRNDEGTMESDVCEPQTDMHSPQVLPSVQRQEINSHLGLENDSMLTQVLETHTDVSINNWITPDDMNDEAQSGFTQLDVESCVRSTYVVTTVTDKKKTNPCQSSVQCDAKRIKLDSPSDVTLGKSDLDAQATNSEHNQYSFHWPLDKLCTTLLGDLWALRWETRHGAASGLRELLSEPKHTRQAGKHFGQSLIEMDAYHYQYLEDIVVRVLCTLALDQLSDFISDEVVAPVRETAAQLLGVLSLHLTIEQVLLVTKHLVFLASLNDETVTQLCSNMPCHKNSTNISKNSWMIAHGGLLGIKYLLAARKDLKDSLLPHVAPCLISRLFGIPITIHTQTASQPSDNPSTLNAINTVLDDEDMRAAAASALLPIVDAVWIGSLSQDEYNLFVNHVWSLIHNTPSDLSPSTGPVLSLVCALTKAEWERRQSVGNHISTIKSEEEVSIRQIDMNTKIMIIIELLHHVTSSIRQSALSTLQCVVESCEDKVASLSVDTLQVILDNLFLRILLESYASIRATVTSLTIKIIQSAQTDCLVQASIRRLDIWLCQVMQPTGIPYPNKFLVTCLKSSDVQLSTSGLNASNDEMSYLPVKSAINADSHITSSNQPIVFIPQHTYCIGGFQCLTTSRSEMESYVLETRISAVRVLAYLCSRICQYNQLVPVHLLPCVSDTPGSSSTSTFPSSANNNNNNSSISVLNYVIGQLLCQLHLKDRLAMQRFISGLLLSTWSLLSPFSSCLPSINYIDYNDINNSTNALNNLSNSLNKVSQMDTITYNWANLLNDSSPTLLSCHLDQLKNLSDQLFSNIQTDLHDIAKQLRGRLESCLTEVIYYEEILAPFKLMQEDCRELIRLMKSCGLSVDTQIPANGVLTIVHCKSLLQTVNETVHSERQYPQHKASCVIDSSLIDRLICQLEKTQNTVDHCLTLQLYLGNRVELGIACAFASMNWILPGRLSLLIRPLMDTIRCMKPCVNQPSNTLHSLNSRSYQTTSLSNAASTTTTTIPSISDCSNSNNSGSSSVVGGNAFIDLLPIGTCVYLQRLAACCLARLLWLEWRMLLSAKLPPSSASINNNSLLPNTSKAAAKVIKNLTSYLMEFDPEGNQQSNEDLSLAEAKIACGNPLSTYRLDMATTTSSLSFEAQCQSSQYRGAYITLSCICYTFITLYHYEEVNDAYLSSSASLSSCLTLKSYDHHLSNSSLNSLRFGIPSLWHLIWINPVKIIISLYSQLGIVIKNGNYTEGGGEIHVTSGSSYSILRKLTSAIKVNMSKVNVIDLPKSTHDELMAGLVVLSTCLNVILPCIDPDREENSCYKEYDISFEQIIWLGSLVIRLPHIAYRRVGARLLANLTLLRPIHTLNILLSLLLFSNNGTFLPTDSLICIGTLETFLTIVEKFSNVHNSSTYAPQDVPPVILDDPLVEPNSELYLSVMHKCFMSFDSEHTVLNSESKPSNTLTANADRYTTNNSNSNNGGMADLSSSNSLKLFLPYLVILLTPTLKLISSSNQQIRSVAGKLFTALLNLLPLEVSLPNPEKMTEAFKHIRAEQREFIDSLLHPDRIQLYNLPIKVNATLRTYQQEGVNWLCFLNRYGLNGVLCDDLGLGKTLQTICILAGSHHELKHSILNTTYECIISNESVVTNRNINDKLPISLVVCPSTLCAHWFHEIQHFAQIEDLNPLIYAGSPTVRLNLQSKLRQHDVIITSYDSVRHDAELFQSVNWNYIVLDEGHIIKSSKSKITHAVKQLVAQHRLILTGTPIQNRVSELWSLFDFLMPEFLGTEQYFLANFARPVAASRDLKASKVDQRTGQLALEKLHRLVLPFMLRRLKEDVMQDLPPKIIQDFACKMTPVQRKLYESFQKTDEGQKVMDIISTTSSCGTHSEHHPTLLSSVSSPHGFHALRYFQAVCNHPCLVLKSNHPLLDKIKQEFCIESMDHLRSVNFSGKLLALCRLLTDCGFGSPNSIDSCSYPPTLSSACTPLRDFDSNPRLLNQHRALIFFQTREMLQLTADMLKEQFPWITSTRLDGTVPVGERHSRVVKFNQDPSIDIMLLTTAVGGLGLNLTGADTVIFVEHDWNPSKDLQAMDRAHRIGQLRTVNVYRLITEDSVEEQIMNLQAFKLHLATTVLTPDNKSLREMDTQHLFDRLMANNDDRVSRETRTVDQFASLDDLEACYEAEYNLDTFVSRLKSN